MNLVEFLSLIEFKTGYKPKASGKGFSAKCPCHEDKKPSLSLAEGNEGKLLVYCHAGCSFGAICEELGVMPTQLFNRNFSKSHGKRMGARRGGLVLFQQSAAPAV